MTFTLQSWDHGAGADPKPHCEVNLKFVGADNDVMQYIRCEASKPTESEEDGKSGNSELRADEDEIADESKSENLEVRPDRGPLAVFSADCRYLRIGQQILEEQESGAYEAVGTRDYDIVGHYPKYVEEFAHRGNLLVLASRRSPYTSSEIEKEIRDNGSCNDGSDSDSDSDSASDHSCESSDSHCHSEDDEAYETWSECSSAGRAGDPVTGMGDCVTEETGSVSSDSEDLEYGLELASDSEDGDATRSLSSSTSSGEGIDPEELAYGQILGHIGEGYVSDEDGEPISPPPRKKKSCDPSSKSHCEAQISVFARHKGRIFHFSRSLSVMLFESPPVIHPTLPLVVWPLGAGDVLFADVEEGTYFIRKIYSSAEHCSFLSTS